MRETITESEVLIWATEFPICGCIGVKQTILTQPLFRKQKKIQHSDLVLILHTALENYFNSGFFINLIFFALTAGLAPAINTRFLLSWYGKFRSGACHSKSSTNALQGSKL